jgi:hypothetical protein
MFKNILKTLEKTGDCIYKVFYDLKMPKIGYWVTTPLYLAEKLTCFIWGFSEKNKH